MKTFAILLALITPFVCYAEVNPYAEGTETVRLTDAERADLLQYLNQSQIELEDALSKAAGKPFEEASEVYFRAVKEVVVESYQERPRTELLMRHILNQAMQLTTGVPGADGVSITHVGVLDGAANPALNTIILEDSIKLALKYVEKDKTAGETGSLYDLPYLGMAAARIALAREWFVGVPQIERREAFLYTVLQNWLTEANQTDQLHKSLIAKELGDVDAVLKSIDRETESSASEKARVLRGALLKLLSELQQKFADDIKMGQSLTQAATADSSDDEVFVAPPMAHPDPIDENLDRHDNLENPSLNATVSAFKQSDGTSGYDAQAQIHLLIPYYKEEDGKSGVGADLTANASIGYDSSSSKVTDSEINASVGLASLFGHEGETKSPTSIGQIVGVPFGYQYKNNAAANVDASIVSISFLNARAAYSTDVNGMHLSVGAELDPIRAIWGKMNVFDGSLENASHVAVGYLTGNAWIKLHAGRLGELTDRFSTDHWRLASSFSGPKNAINVDDYTNWIGVEHVGGTPIGLGYTFSSLSAHGQTNLSDKSATVNRHMVGVQGRF